MKRIIILLAALLVGGCNLFDEPVPPEPSPEPTRKPTSVGEAEIDAVVEEAEHVPVSYLVLGEEMKKRPVEPWESARESVFERPELSKLVESLRAGGYDDEQIAELVWVGSTHNTGQDADAVGRRQALFRTSYREAMGQFRTDLERAASEQGREIDWEAAREAGIVTNFGDQPL